LQIDAIAMPIRPENRDRYPADWKVVRSAILERAGNCCEGSPAFPSCRAENRKPHPVTGSVVILTIAHLDHEPENCDPENLKAWCQRCHLTFDAAHHRETRLARRRQHEADRAGRIAGIMKEEKNDAASHTSSNEL
jgi:hypothetical protein